jgi:hypothetical protein
VRRQSAAPLNHRAVDAYLGTLASASVDEAEPLEVVGRDRLISGLRAVPPTARPGRGWRIGASQPEYRPAEPETYHELRAWD